MRRLSTLLVVLLALLAPRVFGQQIATLRTGDMFDMRLSGMPAESAAEFSLQFTVGQDGTVNVPLIGEMKAVGLTATQLPSAPCRPSSWPTRLLHPIPR